MVNGLEAKVVTGEVPSAPSGPQYPTDQELQHMNPGERWQATRWKPGKSILMNLDPEVVASYATTAGAPHNPPKATPMQRDLPYAPKYGR